MGHYFQVVIRTTCYYSEYFVRNHNHNAVILEMHLIEFSSGFSLTYVCRCSLFILKLFFSLLLACVVNFLATKSKVLYIQKMSFQ